MSGNRSQPAPVDPEREQEPVIAFLSDPDTHGGAPVERIDTHISHIFSTERLTYKLKRAIRRNFLDYSTVERRRCACRREVEINHGTAPGIYLGYRPIVRTPVGLAFDGEGSVVDWVVEMATFDRRLEFDWLADSGRLTMDHVRGLADVVAALHMRAPRRPNFGGASGVGETVGQVGSAIEAAASDATLARIITAWQRMALAAMRRHAVRLDVRRRHGYVRRCHGDLHLGNICLFEDRPTPFDAIEFDEVISSIDVLYDLAFGAMDLLHRGERSLANLLVNRYLAHTRDYSGLALMPLFLSMRAAVRAIPAASDGSRQAEAVELLEFARRSLAPAPAPLLVAVGGFSGSGKSTLAQSLAPALSNGLGAIVLRSDVTRKLIEGRAPEERLPPTSYSQEASQRVYARMRRDAARALRAGVTAILDATFLELAERQAARRLAERAGVPFVALWLSGSRARLGERLGRRGRDPSDATPDLLAEQARAGGAAEWEQVDADASLADVLAAAHRAINARRATEARQGRSGRRPAPEAARGSE